MKAKKTSHNGYVYASSPVGGSAYTAGTINGAFMDLKGKIEDYLLPHIKRLETYTVSVQIGHESAQVWLRRGPIGLQSAWIEYESV
ncbi:MAG: hypothetical protein LBU18_04870 [Treponema sp.]|jgi:hypothetical protein|nr:hypothetical protein [Treponema sp.]